MFFGFTCDNMHVTCTMATPFAHKKREVAQTDAAASTGDVVAPRVKSNSGVYNPKVVKCAEFATVEV